jgi:protein-L-isoaspartate O-methyltransferase
VVVGGSIEEKRLTRKFGFFKLRFWIESTVIDPRNTARALAHHAIAHNRPLDWFDELYRKAEVQDAVIPWADLVPNPNVTALLEKREIQGGNKRALKIGSGLGNDSEYLVAQGFKVVAFDISPTAIQRTRDRFPDSRVKYLVASLFDLPATWKGKFDFIWESYTLQVLPPDLRDKAIAIIPGLLSPRGELVVVSRARGGNDPKGEMPWALTEEELHQFTDHGLACLSFEDYTDCEDPPVRRFRAYYRKER